MGKRRKVRKIGRQTPGSERTPEGATSVGVRPRGLSLRASASVVRRWASPDRRYRLRFAPLRQTARRAY